MIDRHLVLDRDHQANIAIIACQTEPVPFNRAQHTLVSALAGRAGGVGVDAEAGAGAVAALLVLGLTGAVSRG